MYDLMQGYGLLAFVLGASLLVVTIAVCLDVFTRPAVDAVRRTKESYHFHIPTWAERFQKRHWHLHMSHNNHKHRR